MGLKVHGAILENGTRLEYGPSILPFLHTASFTIVANVRWEAF
jgi:hypothetical protein